MGMIQNSPDPKAPKARKVDRRAKVFGSRFGYIKSQEVEVELEKLCLFGIGNSEFMFGLPREKNTVSEWMAWK